MTTSSELKLKQTGNLPSQISRRTSLSSAILVWFLPITHCARSLSIGTVNMAAFTWRLYVRSVMRPCSFCFAVSKTYSITSVSATTKRFEEFDRKLKKRFSIRQKYIFDEQIAKIVVKKLGCVKGQIFVEANPGTGVLTRALINAGVQKVVMLEPEKKFHSELSKLQRELEFGADQLQLVPCDFNKIDGNGPSCDLPNPCKPPLIGSRDLFTQIQTVDWQSDELTARFVGIETNDTLAYKVLMSNCMRIIHRDSIFRFGRSELAFFYPQKRAQRILAKPGDRFYNRLSVLLALFCDVKELHREPCSSFYPVLPGNKEDMVLISLVPKKDAELPVLPHNLPYAAHLVRLFMAKRAQPIVNALEAANPGSHYLLDQMGLPYSVCAANLTSEQFGRLLKLFFQQEGRSDFYYNRR